MLLTIGELALISLSNELGCNKVNNVYNNYGFSYVFLLSYTALFIHFNYGTGITLVITSSIPEDTNVGNLQQRVTSPATAAINLFAL